MGLAKRETNQGRQCLMPGCEDPARVRGMCLACYAWDRYHTKNQHGAAYMAKAQKKAERMVKRCGTRLGVRKPKRQLRVVKGGCRK